MNEAMETQDSINARAARLQSGLAGAFGVRTKTLEKALRRTGRRMPKRLHAEARRIVTAQGVGGHPKLLRRVSGTELDRAAEEVLSFLDAIDRAEARKGRMIALGAALAFNLLVVGGAFVAWMVWAGHL